MENKVVFGLSNVHIAKLTETNGTITYGTPFSLPGAVNLTMDKEGAMSIFRADNTDYYKKPSNNGYSGSLEIADVIEKFLTDILGQYKDANGALFENADDNVSRFAMMFEIEGVKEICTVRKSPYVVSPVCTTDRLHTSCRRRMSLIAPFGWNPVAVK